MSTHKDENGERRKNLVEGIQGLAIQLSACVRVGMSETDGE
jgi:hypothetical protein